MMMLTLLNDDTVNVDTDDDDYIDNDAADNDDTVNGNIVIYGSPEALKLRKFEHLDSKVIYLTIWSYVKLMIFHNQILIHCNLLNV